LTALIYGRLFLRLSPLPTKLAGALTLQFLFGFLLFNTALFVLSLAFPWGVASCFLTLAAVAVAMLFVRGRQSEMEPQTTIYIPDLLCLVISGAGATFWCADALSPIVVDGQNTVFKLWHDSFAHMQIIRTFAQSHGLETVSDLRMAGAPPFLYHYASYFTPAAVVSLTDASGLNLTFGTHV
jgi:thiol:disulfide interchange protein